MDNPVENARIKQQNRSAQDEKAGYGLGGRDITHTIARVLTAIFFVTSFFEPYLNNVIGSIMKYYLVIVIGGVLFLYGKLKLRWYHYMIVGWALLKLLSGLWATDHTIMNSMLVSHIGMTVLLVVLTGCCSDRKMNDTLMFSTMLGGFAIGFLSIFSHHAYDGFDNRQVLVLFGYDNDPNNQASFLVLSIAALLYFMADRRKKRRPVFYILCIGAMAVNFYSLMMTGSRAGLVSAAVVFLYFFLFAGKITSATGVLKKIGALLILAAVGYLILTQFLPEQIYERLFAFNDYEGGSGRTEIWANAWELVWKDLNFFFGAGWGSYWGYNGVTRVLHNTFLSVFCDTGIVGFALLTVPFFYGFFVFHKRRMVGLGCIFLATFVSIFFMEAINKRFFWNALILMLLYYNTVVDGERTAASASPAAKQPSAAETPARAENQTAQ